MRGRKRGSASAAFTTLAILSRVRPEMPTQAAILSLVLPLSGGGNFPPPPNLVAACRFLAAARSIGSRASGLHVSHSAKILCGKRFRRTLPALSCRGLPLVLE